MSPSHAAQLDAPRRRGHTAHPATPARTSVLIVEDDGLIASDLQQLVNELGYDAFATAAGGAEALALAHERRPDVVLMDIRLKGRMDGIDAAIALRRRYGSEIIFLTAHADDATIERARAAAPGGYLVKPVVAQALKAAFALSVDRRERESDLSQRGARLAQVLDLINTAVYVEDAQGRIVYLNRALAGMFSFASGWRPEIEADAEVLARHIGAECEDETSFLLRTSALRRAGQCASGEPVRLRDGRVLERDFVPMPGAALRDGALWAYRDVTERERERVAAEASAASERELVLFDELTGLHSRRGFYNLADAYLRFMQRSDQTQHLFFFDLNNLKHINDTFGHAMGDEALRDMAAALRQAFDVTDLIARLSGDEFVVLASLGEGGVEAAKARIASALALSNASGRRPFRLESSVGVVAHSPGESLKSLLSRADQAMYADKRAAKAAAS